MVIKRRKHIWAHEIMFRKGQKSLRKSVKGLEYSSLHKTEDIPKRGNSFKDKGNFKEDNNTKKIYWFNFY